MMGILYDMYPPKNIDMLGMESGAIAGEIKWMADPTWEEWHELGK